MSSCLLPPIGECLKGKSENKQGENVTLLRICTLAVFVLFCFSGRNSWQPKSVLSTQSENVLQMLQGFVPGLRKGVYFPLDGRTEDS